ncbi:hypothetical protein Hanom_Chr15g01394021 [Helianthus anomalus]
MVGEYIELLVLNCYIYKFCMILKLSISHRDNLYLKYRSLTNIRYFTALTGLVYDDKYLFRKQHAVGLFNSSCPVKGGYCKDHVNDHCTLVSQYYSFKRISYRLLTCLRLHNIL